MLIRITKEWCGNKPGTILSLPPIISLSIIDYYKVAEIVLKDDIEKSPVQSKEIEAAPIDKMIRVEDETKKQDGRRTNGRRKPV